MIKINYLNQKRTNVYLDFLFMIAITVNSVKKSGNQ